MKRQELTMDGRIYQTLNWNELSEMGLVERINREVLNPLGLAMFRDPETGLSGGAMIGEFNTPVPPPEEG